MKKLAFITVILAVLLSGCATHKPGLGSYADATSTYIALNSGNFVEANPLLNFGNPAATALASVGLKHGMKYVLTPLVGEKIAHDSIETGGISSAGWNVALLLGASNPVGIGVAIVSGWLYWEYNN